MDDKLDIREVNVLRYVQPLREGGSLPAIVDGDDDFPYVLKFRGAGQGKKALIAELIGGELARIMALKVPELVFMHLDDSFARTEPDQEIQDLLRFSVGLNLGLHFLSQALTFDPLVHQVEPELASQIVLLDSILSNIDRTPRNTNLLLWKRELWLIDHGASLYFHHNWSNWENHLQRGFSRVGEHVLLPRATKLETAATKIREQISTEQLHRIVNAIPTEWLEEESDDLRPEEKRTAYVRFLQSRLDKLDSLVKAAQDAR